MKRKLPDTSHAAYQQAKPMIEHHHQKIIEALQVLGSANYEVIAAHCKMDRHQIGRRLSELERSLTVFKPGTKTPTKSGRMAYDYCLTNSNQKKTEKPSHKEERAMHEFAESLISATNEIQTDLFGNQI